MSQYAMRPVDMSWRSMLHSLAFPRDNAIVFYWFLPTLFLILLCAPALYASVRSRLLAAIAFLLAAMLWWCCESSPKGLLRFLNVGGAVHNVIFFLTGLIVHRYGVISIFGTKRWLGPCALAGSLGLFFWMPESKFVSLSLAFLGMAFCFSVCLSVRDGLLALAGDYSYVIYLYSWFPQVILRILLGQIHLSVVWLSVISSCIAGVLVPVLLAVVLVTYNSQTLPVLPWLVMVLGQYAGICPSRLASRSTMPRSFWRMRSVRSLPRPTRIGS